MSDIITYDKEGNTNQVWANDLVKAEEVNFYDWICGIGTESIEIKSNGDMFRGTCRVGGKIGHIDDEVWNLPTEFIMCDKGQCTCVADIKSTRYKDQKTRDLLKVRIQENVLKKGGNADSNNF